MQQGPSNASFTTPRKNKRHRRRGSRKQNGYKSSPSSSPNNSPSFAGIVGGPCTPPNRSLMGVARSPMSDFPQVCQMFPHIEPMILREVFNNFGRDANRTIDYFLPHTSQESKTATFRDNKSNGSSSVSSITGVFAQIQLDNDGSQSNIYCDPFVDFPNELALKVFAFIELTQIARFSLTSRDCRYLVKDAFQDIRTIPSSRVTKFKYWSDYRILNMIASFPRLEYVNLRNCEAFNAFKKLGISVRDVTVKRINLSNCAMLESEDIYTLGADFPFMESLDLSKTHITDLGMDYLAERCGCLKSLNIQECQSITDSGLNYFMKRSLNLEQLNLKKTNLHPNALTFPQDNQLLRLDMSHCKRVTKAYFTEPFCILNSLSMHYSPQLRLVKIDLAHIQVLNLSTCKMLETLYLTAPELVKLDLSNCGKLHTIRDIRCPKVQSINLFMCRSLSSDSFQTLVENCGRTIKKLNAGGMTALKDTDVDHALTHCAKLSLFRVDGCKQLPKSSVREIAAKINRIEIANNKMDE